MKNAGSVMNVGCTFIRSEAGSPLGVAEAEDEANEATGIITKHFSLHCGVV